MKKLIIAAFALTTAASVFAQGTVNFNIRINGSPGGNASYHIWGPSTSNSGLSLIGIGSNDAPAGSVDFTAAGMSMIGASGVNAKYGAATTFAQLIGAVGSNQAESSLKPVGQVTTFRTGTTVGGIAAITSTLTGAPAIAADAPFATFEIVAWDNSTGLYSNWALASTAWTEGLIAAGHSAQFNVSNIGGLNPVPFLNNMQPLTSFNLYMVPEPSTFALAGLGAAALLIFRRRK